MKIRTDLDDVIVNLVEPFLKFYNQENGTNFKYEDITTFRLSKVFGTTSQKIQENFDKFNELLLFTNVGFLDGFESFFHKAKHHSLEIITGRPKKTIDLTRRQVNMLFNRLVPGYFMPVEHSSDYFGGRD